MKFLMFLCITCALILCIWQIFRFNHKVKLEHNLSLPVDEFINFKGSEFRRFFFKDLIIRKIFMFYIGNDKYKFVTLSSFGDYNVLLDLGMCEKCNFGKVSEELLKLGKVDMEGFIVPIGIFNSLKKLLFDNDYVNKILFYYDIGEIFKLSDIKEEREYNNILIDKYIIYTTLPIHEDIVINDINVFNPHLFYAVFWCCLFLFGIFVVYRKFIIA